MPEMHARTVITIATAVVWISAPAAQAAPPPATGTSAAIAPGAGLAAVDGSTSAQPSGVPAPDRGTPAPVDGTRSTSPWGGVALVLVAAFAITLATLGGIRLTRLT